MKTSRRLIAVCMLVIFGLFLTGNIASNYAYAAPWDDLNPVCVIGGPVACTATEVAEPVVGGVQSAMDVFNEDCGTGQPFIGWIMCGILNLVVGALVGLFSYMMNFLGDTDGLFRSLGDPASGFQTVWGGLRNLANVIFLLAFLFMIFQYITNINVVDAYFVKKFLPRLVIAVVLVQGSWFIVTEMNSLASAMGESMIAIITGPTKAMTGLGGTELAALLAAVVVNPALIIFFQILLFAILLALVVSFIVLFIRQVLVVALALIAPIALACMAFPQLENLTKKWFKSYVTLLLMYPLIMAFVGISLVLSKAFSTVDNPMYKVMSLLLIFIPFVILPFTFKMAGGIMGKVGGTVNSLARKGKQAATSQAKNAYGKSDFKMGRDAAKDAKMGFKKQNAASVARQRALAGQGSLGKYLRSRPNDDERTLLQAQESQEALRVPAAEEKVKSARQAAAQIQAKQAIEHATQTAAIGGANTKQQNHAAQAAVEAMARQAAQEGNQDAYNSHVATLAGIGGEQALNRLQTEAATSGDQQLFSAWSGAVNDAPTRSAVKGLSPHFGANINNGMDGNELLTERAKAVGTASLEEQAKMGSSGWKYYSDYQQQAGTPGGPTVTPGLKPPAQLLSDVTSDANARSIYKGKGDPASLPADPEAYDTI